MERPSQERAGGGRGEWGAASLALLAGLVVWLWPLGFGGRMPVGGDVTQFAIGLMAVGRVAIRAGRLPLWNDLWGYGFPGVAESQMGVFYPPHLLLYGVLPVEWAYTLSLVAHTAWGAFGAMWAARRFGTSAAGGALAGFCWAASGFFVIHLPHQWGYTVGGWMPWAWGLAWPLMRGESRRREAWLLAGVLAVQMLPGHFQLAFCTQVGLLGMGLWALAERPAGARAAARSVLLLGAALAAAALLAAVQLVPTYRLARLAAARRDFEYLSGFAATPLHLISFVAPGLWHRSPLWRPVVWDPFHTSPEEHLAYLGLVPLFLALGAIRHGIRHDPAVRLLTALALGTLALSLGPYVPGFALGSRLPGFSFFRAPARWGLATELALALLAGRGLDELHRWPRPGRSLARFAGLALAAPLALVLGFELALASTEGTGWSAVAAGFDRALRARPWPDDPSFREVMATARRPQGDLRVRVAQAREGLGPVPAAGLRLSRERSRIYVHELGGTAVLIGGLLVLAPLVGLRRPARGALVALTALDLWSLGRHRPIDLAPIRPLTSQSRVLARLAAFPRGTRTIDPLKNLPMVAGVAPVTSYRTLDLPVTERLTHQAQQPVVGCPMSDRAVRDAMRTTGAALRVFDPFETAGLGQSSRTDGGTIEAIDDPALASWLYGAAWVASPEGARATTFTLWRPALPATRTWLVPLAADVSLARMRTSAGDPADVIEVLERAIPLVWTSPRPEHLEVEVRAEGPAAVVISQLADPEWQADWRGPGGDRPAAIQRVFGGWQAVGVPGPGPWRLHLRYRGRDVQIGLGVSALAWSSWLLTWLWTRRRPAGGGVT